MSFDMSLHDWSFVFAAAAEEAFRLHDVAQDLKAEDIEIASLKANACLLISLRTGCEKLEEVRKNAK